MRYTDDAIRLKAVRRVMGVSQRQFAEKVNVSKRTVISIENAQRGVSREFANAVGLITGVAWDWLRGAVGISEKPLTISAEPFTTKFYLEWEKLRNTPSVKLTPPQEATACHELTEWMRILKAASQTGNFEVAWYACNESQYSVRAIPAIKEVLQREGFGFIHESRFPPGMKVSRQTAQPYLERAACRLRLQSVLHPNLLIEAGKALDAKAGIEPFLKALRDAEADLRELEQLRRKVKPFVPSAQPLRRKSRSVKEG